MIRLNGKIDSNNAAEWEKKIAEQLEGYEGTSVEIDASDLEYISSAGLRVLLRIRKTHPQIRIFDVNPVVYEILDTTGFTQMMEVEKAYRVISIEGCEEIGRGANGTIYRIDQDNVVKVYNNPEALSDIQHEREVAKLALILGIPTAISYDVVKVGDSYGSVFELLNARSFSKILANEPEKMDWCVKESVALLRKIHSTRVPEGKLPDMKEKALSWGEFMKDFLPEASASKLLSLIAELPADDHMIHGDYHTKNVMLQNDEVLLIDMDTLSVGNPIFELAPMYNAYIGYTEMDHGQIFRFQGYDFETGLTFWHKSLSEYLGTTSEIKIREVEEKAGILGYTRMIRSSIRHGGLEDEVSRKEIEFWKDRLLTLLDRTDTLLFSRDELELEAVAENLPEVHTFVNERLEAADCPPNARMQIDVAVEEIFINIASYAYAPEKGKASVRVEIGQDPLTVTITFVDHGVPYDPLSREDPLLDVPASEREIGGLGIFLTKKLMDNVSYEYRDGKNILTLKKNL
ncbi:MAG: anti-sigma factor antagonist [Clostridia bacterium]|nr:anti-sigma factor antagonist [Clostridia bacterium]